MNYRVEQAGRVAYDGPDRDQAIKALDGRLTALQEITRLYEPPDPAKMLAEAEEVGTRGAGSVVIVAE